MRNRAVGLLVIGCLLAALLPLAGCGQFPSDPESTFNKAAKRGSLRVGVIDNPPWTTRSGAGEPIGVEPALVRAFAASHGLKVEWHWLSESECVEALKRFQLDVGIGGFTRKSPWKKEVGLTFAYATSRTVVAAAPTVPFPATLKGAVVAVPQEQVALAGLIEARGATPALSSDPAAKKSGLVAIDAADLELLGLRDTGFELRSVKRALAVPPGENGFLMRLERFLRQRADPNAVPTPSSELGGPS